MNENLPGFRLARVELCNWGTFDEYVWQLTANGRKVKTLRAGSYRFVISDRSRIHDFVLEKEHGGRFERELTDVSGPLEVGDEVVPTFRRGASVDGIHNYVWKTRPVAHAAQRREDNVEEGRRGPAQSQ